jgi:hypothetical protein
MSIEAVNASTEEAVPAANRPLQSFRPAAALALVLIFDFGFLILD